MGTTRAFQWISGFILFFDIIKIMFVMGYAGKFISHFQFWAFESKLNQNNFFKLSFCIKLQIFTDLFCTLLNGYALNIASKVTLKINTFILGLGLINTLGLLLILIFSYSKNYKQLIITGNNFDPEVRLFILSRYPGSNSVEACIQEMTDLILHTKIYLFVSLCTLLILYFANKLTVYIKISKPEKQVTIVDVNHAAMQTNALSKIRAI